MDKQSWFEKERDATYETLDAIDKQQAERKAFIQWYLQELERDPTGSDGDWYGAIEARMFQAWQARARVGKGEAQKKITNMLQLSEDFMNGEQKTCNGCDTQGEVPHSTQCYFGHFLSYSGFCDLPNNEIGRLRIAYEHGAYPLRTEKPVEVEQPETLCQESDGCPTEMAVLKRFWRASQAKPVEAGAIKEYVERFNEGHEVYGNAIERAISANATDTELTRLKRQVEVLREGLKAEAERSTSEITRAHAQARLASADRIAKGEV